MNDHELNRLYTQQIRDWIEQSGLTQKQIVALSELLPIDSSIDETKLSRMIDERPARAPRRHALVKLLGVFCALDVIDCHEAQTFWQTCEIGEFPDSLTWDTLRDLSQQKQPEIMKARNALLASSSPTESQEPAAYSFPRAGIIVLGLVLAVMLITAAIILLGQQQDSDVALAQPVCSEPVKRVEPTFLFEQGLSLYTPPEDSEGGLLIPAVRSITTDETGLWIGYKPQAEGIGGISHYADTTREWMHCGGLNLSEGQVVNDIVTQDETIYIAIDGAGVARLKNEQWTIYTTEHGLPSDTVYDLEIDTDNRLWASTLEGVAVLAGEYWEVVYRAEVGKLAGNQVHNLLLHDDTGNRWFALAFGGVSVLQPDGTWQTYFQDTDGLKNVRALAQDQAGGVWMGSDGGGVARYQDGEWQHFTTSSGDLPSDNVQDVEVDPFGRIWVATDRGVVYSADNGASWQLHSTLDTIDIEAGCAKCETPQDNLWLVIKDQGLAHADLPPENSIVRIEAPPLFQLKPGEKYIFEVTVEVLAEDLSEGDGLFSTTPELTRAYGAWPIIPVVGLIEQGQEYTFSNVNDPIIAPEEPGLYETEWRVWQSNRYVSEPITIAFEVVE